MGKKKKEILGCLYGRPDLERCDIFMDTGFLLGKHQEFKGGFNEAAAKGRQMFPGVPGSKSALQGQSGYFDPVFKRLFIGDKFVDKWVLELPAKTKLLKGTWRPTNPAKKHCTPGDSFGTFADPNYKAFSPLCRPRPPYRQEPRNILTNPGKKGGPGYKDITIGKYPEHCYKNRVDKFNWAEKCYSKKWEEHKQGFLNGPLNPTFFPQPYFDQNPFAGSFEVATYGFPKYKMYGKFRGIFIPPSYPKKPGNMHDGCFSKFPAWQPEKYLTRMEVEKLLASRIKVPKKFQGKIFYPEPRIKKYYTPSVVNNKIDFACNQRTWTTMKPISYPQFNY